MKVDGKSTRTIWLEPDGWSVGVIDQTALPHRYVTARLTNLAEAAHAIRAMVIRGAPLIGAAAAYGMCLALRADASDAALERAYATLLGARPTAINLKWALEEMMAAVRNRPRAERDGRRLPARGGNLRRGRRHQQGDRPQRAAADRGDRRAQEARRAGQRAHPLQRRLARHRRRGHRHGADLSGARQGHRRSCLCRRDAAAQPGRFAHRLGARPARRAAHADRRQYRRPPDAARPGRSGHRRHRPGDRQRRRRNKIGTYLKALAAHDNGVPFYVALPSPTIDFTIEDGSPTFRSRSAGRGGGDHVRAGPDGR